MLERRHRPHTAGERRLNDLTVGADRDRQAEDQWDGYHPARERLLSGAPPNFVTLTGDIHLAGAAEIGPIGDPVGIEFITTAISSTANVDPALADVVLSISSIVDGDLVSRGYTRHTVTTDAWTAEYRQVVDIADADSDLEDVPRRRRHPRRHRNLICPVPAPANR